SLLGARPRRTNSASSRLRTPLTGRSAVLVAGEPFERGQLRADGFVHRLVCRRVLDQLGLVQPGEPLLDLVGERALGVEISGRGVHTRLLAPGGRRWAASPGKYRSVEGWFPNTWGDNAWLGAVTGYDVTRQSVRFRRARRAGVWIGCHGVGSCPVISLI